MTLVELISLLEKGQPIRIFISSCLINDYIVDHDDDDYCPFITKDEIYENEDNTNVLLLNALTVESIKFRIFDSGSLIPKGAVCKAAYRGKSYLLITVYIDSHIINVLDMIREMSTWSSKDSNFNDMFEMLSDLNFSDFATTEQLHQQSLETITTATNDKGKYYYNSTGGISKRED